MNSKFLTSILLLCFFNQSFSQSLIKFSENGKFGFKNSDNVIVVPAQYDVVKPFSDGLSCVINDGLSGYIDEKGKIVIPFRNIQGFNFSEGLAAVYNLETKKYEIIDKSGKIIINAAKYDFVGEFKEGFAVVSKNLIYGYIDKSGKETIPLQYSSAKPFYQGKATVKKGDRTYSIDKMGNEIKVEEQFWGY